MGIKKLTKKLGKLTMTHPGGIVSEHFREKKREEWVKAHKDCSPTLD